MSKLLGIDWGSKRIGLAIAGVETKLARPLPSLSAGSNLSRQLAEICQQQGVTKLVLGLPRGLNGQETAQTRQVRQFAKELQAQLNLPIVLQDEALTTQAIKQRQSRGKPKMDIDSEAAAMILQDYLETL
ncbi:Holliday junction resolvase RuvX [Candidatus Microgenomates bacterium]|nr:Holliday junction resolvase RuvX [Candidatus Microgenomates bacterium]